MTTPPFPELIAIGETMLLVTPRDAGPLEHADDVRATIGGAESNVAAHLAALGHRSAWIGMLGDDALGRRVLRDIAAHDVDVRWAGTDPDAPTGVYFKDPGRGVLYYRAGSAASRMSPATIAAVPLEQAAIVHLSGITPALSDGCASLVDTVITRLSGAPALVSFDVNHRAALWSASVAATPLRDLASRADIVFVGLDEAETLWGCASAEEVRAVLPSPQRLIVKDGGIGATEFSEDGTVFQGAIPTDVVEAVGAGDAFAAGYLAALLDGHRTADRLRAGHERARLVLQSTDDVIGREEPNAAQKATAGEAG